MELKNTQIWRYLTIKSKNMQKRKQCKIRNEGQKLPNLQLNKSISYFWHVVNWTSCFRNKKKEHGKKFELMTPDHLNVYYINMQGILLVIYIFNKSRFFLCIQEDFFQKTIVHFVVIFSMKKCLNIILLHELLYLLLYYGVWQMN